MNFLFLDKVVDQIVSETRIDYENDRIFTPFLISSSSPHPLPYLPLFLFSKLHNPFSPSPPFFIIHCKDVYGLNKEETEYVWKEYNDDIVYKISQNY